MNNLIETICKLWWIEAGVNLKNPRSKESILALERVLKDENFDDIVVDYVIETIVRTPPEFKGGEDEDTGVYVDDDETAVSAVLGETDDNEDDSDEETPKPKPKEDEEDDDEKQSAEDDIKTASLTAYEKEKLDEFNIGKTLFGKAISGKGTGDGNPPQWDWMQTWYWRGNTKFIKKLKAEMGKYANEANTKEEYDFLNFIQKWVHHGFGEETQKVIPRNLLNNFQFLLKIKNKFPLILNPTYGTNVGKYVYRATTISKSAAREILGDTQKSKDDFSIDANTNFGNQQFRRIKKSISIPSGALRDKNAASFTAKLDVAMTFLKRYSLNPDLESEKTQCIVEVPTNSPNLLFNPDFLNIFSHFNEAESLYIGSSDIKISAIYLDERMVGVDDDVKVESLTEASYLDPKYKPGHKIIFNKKAPPKWAPNLKMGDVLTIVTDDPSVKTVGDGEFVKTLELPTGKIVRVASTNRSGGDGSKFIHSKGGAATPSGEDWESLIIVAFNNQFEGYEWERSEKYWDNYGDDAVKIAEAFKDVIKSNSLSQLGASTAALNPDWGGTNKTPKTDILGNNNERISLKKAGGSQLMSGGQSEALATFDAAMKMVGENKPKILDSFLNKIETKMGRMTEAGTITALQKVRDSGKKLTPAQEKSIAEMEQLQLNAKEINQDMESVFKDIYFKSCFCFEAATGTNKFADKDAVANQLIEFNPGNGKITAHLPMNKIEDAKPLATSNSFYVSFKSGGSKSKPYLALRTKKLSKKKMLGENIETFQDIVFEEFSKSDYGISILNEAVEQQLNEFQIFNKLSKGLKDISSKVKSQAKKILDAILKRIKSAFEMIKKLGKNIFNGIMHFLDMEVSSVKISSGGPFPLV
jgi:hypothetical protein